MEILTLHNDDVNSFEKIQAALIRYCEYNPMQAEQSAIIANNCGKVIIKEGDFMDILELENKFLNLNIKVTRSKSKIKI
jgi:hypothetical protein